MLLSEPCRRGPVPVVRFQQLPFAGLHRQALRVVGVVVPEHVQHAVHDEQSQFIFGGAGMFAALPRRHRRTDHDVSEKQ
ncbi:MAG TPA: hypothetical protein VLD86_12820, partial [Ilumatobacteraceae bacterium]|nr:hypothetical protein [Ilumatobacteraceae bacterium]